MSSSSSRLFFTIVYCARVFFAFAELMRSQTAAKKQSPIRGRKKKKKVGSEVENVII